MKELNDPQRLLSAAPRDSLLERGLTVARRRGPTDAELSALRASLFGSAVVGAALLAGRTARAGARPGATAGSTGWQALGLTKAATALVVASAIAGGTAVGWHRTHPIRPEQRARSASVVKTKDAPKVAPLAPAAPLAMPAPAASERRRSSRVAAATRPRAVAPSAPTAPPEADDELALLGEAQGALPTDPARALAFVREHERRYPDGLLGEEREAVAVSALWQIGRRDEARRRAEQFAAEYPRSTYLGRMRRILTQPDDETPLDKDDDIPPSTVGGPK